MTIAIETPPPAHTRHTTWRQVAGSELSSRSFRFATVPDGPGLDGWSGGEVERIEAKNRALLAAHFAKPAQPKMAAPTEPAGAIERSERAAELIATIPDDLSIPPFLRRTVKS
jgi:hypothetical protein